MSKPLKSDQGYVVRNGRIELVDIPRTPFYKRLHWVDVALVAAIALVIIAVLVTGNMDYAESKRQEREYCQNVQAKVWPDFRNNYRKLCLTDNNKHD